MSEYSFNSLRSNLKRAFEEVKAGKRVFIVRHEYQSRVPMDYFELVRVSKQEYENSSKGSVPLQKEQ